ncbi:MULTISPECIES: type II toxin-antitoxin system PemK/MazF family toxin [Bacteria]|uniref:type II toxin-antitoxin system PemK/MazF family toxin n=1 Tax=Bacteria TaxID=2 RepID=UPI003C7B7592
MSRSGNGILSALVDAAVAIVRALAGSQARGSAGVGSRSAPAATGRETPSEQAPGTETVEVDPQTIGRLDLAYSPRRDGDPDAGEVIWTWVPYAERDGRGKDRPVLVIARQGAERVYAVKLTSKSHDQDRDYLSIGTGPWDGQGRESWVDIDQLYSVHRRGMRREAAALDRSRYERVAAVLQRRYGWGRAA